MTTEQNEQTTAQPAAGLTLNDLAAVLKVIELTNSRGAFKPEELQAVGILYQKIAGFIQATQPQQPEETKEGEAGSGTPETKE